MVGVVDYGGGNLRSVETALRHLGADFFIAVRPEDIGRADRLLVPGVGEARAAMEGIQARGLERPLQEFRRSGRPFLGICIGSQVIFEHSEERQTRCLGFLPGSVRRFPTVPGLKVPHMGWNGVSWAEPQPLFAGLTPGDYFYFVHSYYPQPAEDSLVLAECDYGVRFAAAVGRGNLLAVQFHPEKSGASGLRLLANFLDWSP
jgi:glutamine amidotransferase